MNKNHCVPGVTPGELAASKSARVLLDVRTPAEFDEVHIEGSVNVPLGDLSAATLPAADELVLVCRTGNRANKAWEALDGQGHAGSATVLVGGVVAWEAEGRQVVRGKNAVSIDRQVRIAAGALVLTGSVLAIWWPPLVLLPAAVGAGLVFSGVTDTCAMGVMLARLPHNRRRRST